MAIYCDQTGYLPQEKKMAVMTAGSGFWLIKKTDTEETTVLEGNGDNKGLDGASGDVTVAVDFSEIAEEGTYYIKNDAGEVSHSFRIGKDVYRSLQKDLTKALYYQRCGCGLKAEHAGEYAHECCHIEDAALWENPAVKKEVRGGWHDAGDFGRYISPAAVTVGHLLYAFTLFPSSFEEELRIPESGNGVPDVLNECRYELEWMLKMQDDEGGAYHKLTSQMHAPFIMPEEDKEQFYLFPVSSMATADYAASMALASRVYRAYDEAFADRLLLAAKTAYGWLEKHPEYVGFHNPEGCNTGEYDDECDSDERLWAAAEMLVTTGEKKYQDRVTELLQEKLTLVDFGWTDVSGFASLSILTDAAKRADAKTAAVLQKAVFAEADRLAEVAKKSGYGVAMEAKDYVWGSNMVVLNRGMLLILAAMLAEKSGDKTAQEKYIETALGQIHYLLGRNAVDYSYVTGYGEHAYMHPHNRTTECDGIELPMPGWVSGGPFKTPVDEVGVERIKPGTPPMKCYVDHAACYSLNEITIYWNSPAIFVIAFFNQK